MAAHIVLVPGMQYITEYRPDLPWCCPASISNVCSFCFLHHTRPDQLSHVSPAGIYIQFDPVNPQKYKYQKNHFNPNIFPQNTTFNLDTKSCKIIYLVGDNNLYCTVTDWILHNLDTMYEKLLSEMKNYHFCLS